MTTTIKNFPQTDQRDRPCRSLIRIDSLDIVLVEVLPAQSRPSAIRRGRASRSVSYEDPSHTSTAEASYTPTGCPPPPPPAKPRCGGRVATEVGTAKHDVLTGTRGRDVIAGLGGDDTLKGLAGNDLLCGGRGRDKLFGGQGRDRLLGGPGRDELHGGPGKDAQRQ